MVVCVIFFKIFLRVRWELQNSMKTTFQKWQTLEQIMKDIPGAVKPCTMIIEKAINRNAININH